MATRSWAFRPLSPDSLLRDSAEWANVLNSFLNFTDEGLDISSNTGDIGTITVGVLQGAELTIDLNATGTDPVLLHDSFSLNADGSASFAGDLDAVNGTFGTITAGTLNGDAIDIYLGVGGGPGGVVISHQNFGLYADGTAEFDGGGTWRGAITIDVADGYGITFDDGVGGQDSTISTTGGTLNITGGASLNLTAGTSTATVTGTVAVLSANTGGITVEPTTGSPTETDITISTHHFYIGTAEVLFATGANDSYAAGYRTVTWYSPNV